MSYLYLPGRAGNNATAPGSAATNITGDLAVAVRVFNPKPGLVAGLMSKWAVSTQWSLMWSSGTSQAYLYIKVAAGTFGVVAPSFFPTNFSTPMWIAATRRQSDGRVQFFYSNDQSPRPISEMTWTQVGADATLRAGDAIDSGLTSPIDFGSPTTGIAGSTYIGAHVYRGWVGSGADLATATTAFDANFEAQAPGTVSFTEDSPNAATVTVGSSNTEPKAGIVGRKPASGLSLPGRSANYASTPDAAVLDITGDLTLVAKVTMSPWFNKVSFGCLMGKWTGSFTWGVTNGGQMGFYWKESAATKTTTSTALVPFMAGQDGWLAVTLDVDNGAGGNAVKFWYSADGITWAQLGSTVTTAGVTFIDAGTNRLTMGLRDDAASDSLFAAIMYRAQVYNGSGFSAAGPSGTLVFDADFSKQPRGTVAFTEDANGATVTVASSVNDPKAMILGRVG